MHRLRAILIALLVIAIPLPATAAAFDAPPCMPMAADVSARASDNADTQFVSPATVSDQATERGNCCCDECVDCATCDAPCATGCIAASNPLPQHLPMTALKAPRACKLPAKALPAYLDDPIRPPASLLS